MNRDVEKILSARRAAAENRAALDREKAMSIPSYREAELRVRELNFEIAMHDANRTAERDEWVARRDAIASAHGLRPEPVYECPICRDTGLAHGKLCSCAKKLTARELKRKLNLADSAPIGFDAAEFERFGEKETYMRSLYAKLRDFCEKFDRTKVVNLLLFGSVGSGKTFLASCVLNALEEREYSTLFLSAFEFDRLCFANHTSLDKQDLLDALLDADFVVIDDLGTEPIYRNVTLEYLYSVLNDRMNRGKKTMITTNLDPEQLFNRYGERIFSRLNNKENCVTLKIDGADLRRKGK